MKFEASENDPATLGSIVCERTRLEGQPGQQRAFGTGQFETIPAQLALISIGYKAVALSGIEHWFDDERDILKHEHGLVDGATAELGGLYTAGWLKRGPSGIIGTNIGDARDTVATILANLDDSVRLKDGSSYSGIITDLNERGVEVVEWEGYRRIEKAENARRRSDKQPREKIISKEEQVQVALSS